MTTASEVVAVDEAQAKKATFPRHFVNLVGSFKRDPQKEVPLSTVKKMKKIGNFLEINRINAKSRSLVLFPTPHMDKGGEFKDDEMAFLAKASARKR